MHQYCSFQKVSINIVKQLNPTIDLNGCYFDWGDTTGQLYSIWPIV